MNDKERLHTEVDVRTFLARVRWADVLVCAGLLLMLVATLLPWCRASVTEETRRLMEELGKKVGGWKTGLTTGTGLAVFGAALLSAGALVGRFVGVLGSQPATFLVCTFSGGGLLAAISALFPGEGFTLGVGVIVALFASLGVVVIGVVALAGIDVPFLSEPLTRGGRMEESGNERGANDAEEENGGRD